MTKRFVTGKGGDGKCKNGLYCRGVAAEIVLAAPLTDYNQQACAAAHIRADDIVIPNLRR